MTPGPFLSLHRPLCLQSSCAVAAVRPAVPVRKKVHPRVGYTFISPLVVYDLITCPARSRGTSPAAQICCPTQRPKGLAPKAGPAAPKTTTPRTASTQPAPGCPAQPASATQPAARPVTTNSSAPSSNPGTAGTGYGNVNYNRLTDPRVQQHRRSLHSFHRGSRFRTARSG